MLITSKLPSIQIDFYYTLFNCLKLDIHIRSHKGCFLVTRFLHVRARTEKSKPFQCMFKINKERFS